MKILIFSDVHGNLPALESMLKHAGPCDSYICLGDIVNYGPWSNECVELVQILPCCINLMGNHEEDFIRGNYSGNNFLVKTFFNFCKKDFNKIEIISKFKQDYSNYGFCFKHTLNNSYIYPDTNIELDGNYVIGHSHHQFSYSFKKYILYNSGSVGQNRKYINVINYLELNTETNTMDLKYFKYNVDLVINAMILKNYPRECVDYYQLKPRLL